MLFVNFLHSLAHSTLGVLLLLQPHVLLFHWDCPEFQQFVGLDPFASLLNPAPRPRPPSSSVPALSATVTMHSLLHSWQVSRLIEFRSSHTCTLYQSLSISVHTSHSMVCHPDPCPNAALNAHMHSLLLSACSGALAASAALLSDLHISIMPIGLTAKVAFLSSRPCAPERPKSSLSHFTSRMKVTFVHALF
jgi:hypothetical protein